jgi:hypothetical protein
VQFSLKSTRRFFQQKVISPLFFFTILFFRPPHIVPFAPRLSSLYVDTSYKLGRFIVFVVYSESIPCNYIKVFNYPKKNAAGVKTTSEKYQGYIQA